MAIYTRQVKKCTSNQLYANQFFSFSKTGKMLMARCKKLLEENSQLGTIISSDNVAKLEGEVALQNRLVSNMKDSQKGKEITKHSFLILTRSLQFIH
jgi:hypothetical protein